MTNVNKINTFLPTMSMLGIHVTLVNPLHTNVLNFWHLTKNAWFPWQPFQEREYFTIWVCLYIIELEYIALVGWMTD